MVFCCCRRRPSGKYSKLLQSTEAETSAVLQSRALTGVPPEIFLNTSLLRLDLSRNKIRVIPPAIGALTALTFLDLSRNELRVLPPELRLLGGLKELHALSNNLRPSGLPVAELAAGLVALRVLDLRFNDKVVGASRHALAAALPWVLDLRVTVRVEAPPPSETCGGGVVAGLRDATLLRSQLDAISTPRLRARLEEDFGQPRMDPEDWPRSRVMELLLECYAAEGPRAVRQVRGALVSEELRAEMLERLRAMEFPGGAQRERRRVMATGYVTLQRPTKIGVLEGTPTAQYEIAPLGRSKRSSNKARLAMAKLQRHARLWELAAMAIREVDPEFAELYSHIALTKNFVGSPHIDTQNVGPFYGMSLGDFSEGGGKICVECSARLVAEVDTHNRLGKVDGRYTHWVTPYEGERYSVIYYQTEGRTTEPRSSLDFYPPPTG